MTSLITPDKRYEHLPALQAKEILHCIASMDRKSFNVKMNDDEASAGSEPFVFYLNFFIKQGLLEAVQGAGFRLTQNGISLLTGKIREAIHRDEAAKEIAAIRKRAAWILDDPDQIYFLRGVFIFGSYVDSQKDFLGDIDVAISYGVKPEYSRLSDAQFELVAKEINRRSGSKNPVDDAKIWATDRMFECVQNGNDFISLHRLKELPTLNIVNTMWIYDSKEQVTEGFLLRKNELPMINRYLNLSM